VPPFAERAAAAIAATGPLCVGVDPSPSLLAAWGLPDDAGGLRTFGARCIEALAGTVPALKPQVAFFERRGSAGIAVLESLLRDAKDAGLLVVADAKRGDIGSTAQAYADAWLRGPLAADAVTATPYLGLGALGPLIDAAHATGRGVLVVVASSNPEGREVQEATTRGGATVEARLLADIGELNRQGAGGAVGAVVGATRGPPAGGAGGLAAFLGAVGGLLLAPGVGAQGATPGDVAALFAGCPPGSVLPSVSRALLEGGPAGLRDAAGRLRDELARALR
jgi:orotidine-5'-phosphate decarboxylase